MEMETLLVLLSGILSKKAAQNLLGSNDQYARQRKVTGDKTSL